MTPVTSSRRTGPWCAAWLATTAWSYQRCQRSSAFTIWRDYINFLHPVRKLVSKTRNGPRVTRRYDLAQTPYHRLLDSGVLSIKMTSQLKTRSRHIDPYRLKVQLESAQRTLAARAVQSDSYLRQL